MYVSLFVLLFIAIIIVICSGLSVVARTYEVNIDRQTDRQTDI